MVAGHRRRCGDRHRGYRPDQSPGPRSARVLGADGRGYVSDMADGVMWPAGIAIPGVPRNTTPAEVVDPSDTWDLTSCTPVTRNTVNRMHQIGVPVVVAAGRASKSAHPASPVNCGGAVVVGAASFHNRLTEGRDPNLGVESTRSTLRNTGGANPVHVDPARRSHGEPRERPGSRRWSWNRPGSGARRYPPAAAGS